MKKLLSILLAVMLAASMIPAMALAASETYELALVTDLGDINDGSFNQGSWEGLVQYAEENGVSHKYYKPRDQSDTSYLDSITLAVEGGAKLIVTPGFLFATPVYLAQDMYPDVKFVLIDDNPHSADYSEYRTESNAVGIVFAEEQSGFLAGYAVVKDGFTKLGFMGGMALPAVMRFGYGFIQGADYAAKELGISGLTVNYYYTGGFSESPEVQSTAAAWYSDGVEVIFGCGGSLGYSVMKAAEGAPEKWVVGVDVDQSNKSDRVIISAAKGLRESVYQAIDAAYKNEFPGGESWVLGADRDGVSLPMASSKLRTFTQADYDAIYAKLVAGEIAIKNETAAEDASALSTDAVTVTVVK